MARCTAQANEVGTVTLDVEGMTCASCVSTVERALSGVAGVMEAHVNLVTGQVRAVDTRTHRHAHAHERGCPRAHWQRSVVDQWPTSFMCVCVCVVCVCVCRYQ